MINLMEVNMDASDRFNTFLKDNAGPRGCIEENLMIEYEDGLTRVYWVSVYGRDFIKAPKGFFTKPAIYQEFCVDVAGIIPADRTRPQFHSYMNERLSEAVVRDPSPGMEAGTVVRNAIFSTLWQFPSTQF